MTSVSRLLSDFSTMWRAAENWEQFTWNLAGLGIRRPLATYLCHVFQPDAKAPLPDAESLFRRTAEVKVNRGTLLARLELPRTSLAEDYRKGVAAVWPRPDLGYATVIALAPSFVWERVVLARLASAPPAVSKPTLTQDALRKLLVAIEQKLSAMRLRVRKATSRRWVVSNRRRVLASRIDWEDLSLPEAFAEARDEHKWFSSIKFEMQKADERPTGISALVSRHGYLQTGRTCHEFFALMAPILGDVASERYRALSGRSRADTPGHKPRPLAVQYDQPFFRDKANNARLISAVRRVPYFGYTVVHANPYVHVMMTDYVDGSSYDIYVLEESRMLLIPQIRATPGSLDRLLSGLSVHFPEGRLVEASAVYGE